MQYYDTLFQPWELSHVQVTRKRALCISLSNYNNIPNAKKDNFASNNIL